MSAARDGGDFSDIWSQAVDGSGTGLWDRDVAAGTIRYSRSWRAILGCADEPAVQPVAAACARVHPDDLADVEEKIDAHLAGRTTGYEVEYRLRCHDGGYRWVLSRGRVVDHDAAGRPLRMVGTTTDITALRTLAEELRRQRTREQETSAQLAALTGELRRRTSELAAAHRLAGVGGWRWDPGRQCLWFSPEAWWLLGRPVSDTPVSYAEMRAMLHPDDQAGAAARFEEALRHRVPVTLEYRLLHPDGSVREVLTHAEPVLGPDGGVLEIRGTTQDITPYRRIEAALRESEDHYRHMVDLHPQIPWTAAPDGGILEVGPQWLAMTGMTREAAMPFGWTAAVHPDDIAGALAAWRHCRDTGAPLDIEYRLRLAAGGHGWVRARAAARRDEVGQIIRWYGTLEDVTDRRAAEAARQASEALAFRVLEATGDAVIVCDRAGSVTFANARAAALLGASGLRGRRVEALFAEAHGRRIREAMRRAMAAGGDARAGSRATDARATDAHAADGHAADACSAEAGAHFELFWPPADLWLEASVFATADDVSLFLRDVSETRLAQQKLRYAATHDFMTGAANRATLFDRLADRLAQQTPGDLTALLCLDLDYFKEINDAHGHPVGDALLQQVANRLQSCLRAQDLLARCGGDEFAILQTGVRTTADAETLARRILAAMREKFEIDGLILADGLSIGIAVSTLEGADADLLYSHADRALYEAKTAARGGYRVFHPEMQAAFEAARILRADLAAGLLHEEFFLLFQPIIDLATGRTVGVEALLRWRHPERGVIPPAEFIPLAEESGQIGALGAWALQRACETALAWPEDVKVSVNVSPRQFELGDLGGVVRAALRAAGLPPDRLKLEVTESILLAQNTDNLAVLQDLRDLGVTLVLDDFGTGYSSLSYLDRFKFDFVKIDKSFIARVRAGGDRQPIFEAIVGMAAALGLPVTAEGVETEVQLDYVRRLGCGFAQGHLFSPPVAPAALAPQLIGPVAAAAEHRLDAPLA